jgi:predicted aldo/keto reductase-like oxidoreductase
MSDEDHEFIHRVRDAFESKKSVGCTECWYCMPCPRGVGIPEVFKLYNSYQQMNDPHVRAVYQNRIVQSGTGADQCVSCGICAQHCPQGLKIPGLLKTAHAELTVSA